MEHRLELPLAGRESFSGLYPGDLVLLSGVIYTARDQAHRRLVNCLDMGEKPPFDLEGSAIYYCGPTPPREDGLFGAAGPTTAARMDPFAPRLYDAGIAVTIGKGGRNDAVRDACIRNRALYLVTFGGAAAYLAKRITSQELIAWPDLGAEAVYRLTVENFPCVVGFDVRGASVGKALG
jgi:fumarate hydratase subunit beta